MPSTNLQKLMETQVDKCLSNLDLSSANVSCAKTIQGWLSPAVPVCLRFAPLVKLMARICSATLGRDINFLDVLMQESNLVIDEWDGKDDYPQQLEMPSSHYRPFNDWCVQE